MGPGRSPKLINLSNNSESFSLWMCDGILTLISFSKLESMADFDSVVVLYGVNNSVLEDNGDTAGEITKAVWVGVSGELEDCVSVVLGDRGERGFKWWTKGDRSGDEGDGEIQV